MLLLSRLLICCPPPRPSPPALLAHARQLRHRQVGGGAGDGRRAVPRRAQRHLPVPADPSPLL
eukprot:9666675-Alexandrium_andersonii.AAC.1